MKKITKLDKFKQLITQAVPEVVDFEFYSEKGSEFNRKLKQFSADLGKTWNYSGFTDFSVYNHKDYLIECIWTYVVSSGAATGNMAKYFKEAGIDVSDMECLDYYNGIGLTTLDLVNMGFKRVTYFNDCHWQMLASDNLLQNTNARYVRVINDNIESLKFFPMKSRYDCVVCLETIEHYKEPMHITEKLMALTQNYLVETTSFCSPQHYGHFDKYLIDGKEVSGMTASRRVHDLIRTEFEQVFSGFNGRPRIWKRK